MTKVVTHNAPIIELTRAFFVSTMNNKVIYGLLFSLNILQGLTRSV